MSDITEQISQFEKGLNCLRLTVDASVVDILLNLFEPIKVVIQNKESDVSAEEIEEASQRAYPFLRNSDIDTMKNRETFKTGANWYASIVNERKDTLKELYKIFSESKKNNSLIPYTPEKEEEKDEDSLWYEVMLESEASRSYPDFFDRCKKRFSITRKLLKLK